MVKNLHCRAIDLGFFCQISNPPPVFVAMMGGGNSSLAGVETPAFVEGTERRKDHHDHHAVSPGLKPRPSLRGGPS